MALPLVRYHRAAANDSAPPPVPAPPRSPASSQTPKRAGGPESFFCQVLPSWDPFAECAILQGRPTRSSLSVYTIPFPSLSPQKIWPASHCTFNSCFFLVTLHCGISPNLHAHFPPVHVYFVNAPLPPLSLPFIPWWFLCTPLSLSLPWMLRKVFSAVHLPSFIAVYLLLGFKALSWFHLIFI